RGGGVRGRDAAARNSSRGPHSCVQRNYGALGSNTGRTPCTGRACGGPVSRGWRATDVAVGGRSGRGTAADDGDVAGQFQLAGSVGHDDRVSPRDGDGGALGGECAPPS